MATIFKSLAPSDYSITPFPSYYNYTCTYVSGSTEGYDPSEICTADVQILYGNKYPFANIGDRVPTPQYDLYDSIVQIFYSSSAFASYGIQNTSYIPENSMYVVSVTQDMYGETIVPGTFTLTVNSTTSHDDGVGNLIVTSSGIGRNIGFVFYDKGIAVIKPSAAAVTSITNDGLYIGEDGAVQIDFRSTLTVYEHRIYAKVKANEFLHAPNNPTSRSVVSGSSRAIDLMVTQQFAPYVTTIGLYNNNNELLAVAKVSNPIQRTSDVPQTFVVKFDT